MAKKSQHVAPSSTGGWSVRKELGRPKRQRHLLLKRMLSRQLLRLHVIRRMSCTFTVLTAEFGSGTRTGLIRPPQKGSFPWTQFLNNPSSSTAHLMRTLPRFCRP